MSHQFTIDGIEEVFRDDVLRLIANLRRQLEHLREKPDDPTSIEDVRATGHSLKGTSSLVGLICLSRCGAVIERMAEVASTFATSEPSQAVAVFSFLGDSLPIVERLLEASLERSTVQVQEALFREVCAVFPVQLQGYFEGFVQPLPASGASAEPAAPAGERSEEDEFARELAEVFALELQEQLENVPGELELLANFDTRPMASRQLNRIFHTIKGSAAMVGLSELSETAKRFEKLFGDPDRLSLEVLEQAQPDMEIIYSTASLPAPDVAMAFRKAAEAAAPGQAELDRELLEAFSIEAQEAIERTEQLLLELERQPEDTEVLQALFREFHTLKGASRAVGLDAAGEQLHLGESLLESVVEGEVAVDPGKLVDFLFRLTDSVVALINRSRGVEDPRRQIMSNVEDAVAGLCAPAEGAPVVAPVAPAAPEIGAPLAKIPVAEVPVEMAAAPVAEPAAPAVAEAEAGVVRVQAGRLDALLNQVGQLVVTRTRMDQKIHSFADLRGRLDYCRTRLADTIEGFQKRFEFTIGDSNPMAAQLSDAAGTESGPGSATARGRADEYFTDLEFDKYDDFNILARSVIELATDTGEVANQLDQFVEALGEEVRQFSKITSSLQRQITGLRLVPIDVVFRRLLRPVRDAARQEGKLVRLEVQGGDVQLDRAVVEGLYPPLLHIVRNCVSHGIELPGVREVRGKPHTGTIRVAATARHNSVTLTVVDDGAGIDFLKIEKKARHLGLLESDAPATREQLLSFIFRSGFSTQEAVTDLAGRGVGMDVVARQVAALNGSLLVDSQDGLGTSMRLALPVTTSIDEVLILEAGAQVYALPVDFVERVVAVGEGDVVSEGDRSMLTVGDELVQAIYLAPLVREALPEGNAVAVVLRAGERAMALIVDHVRAQQEVVIRPLSRLLGAHPFLSGATISGAGAVIFVLHVGRLFEILGYTAEQFVEEAVQGPVVSTELEEAAKTILVVDDSISVRKLATRFLESDGFEVEVAIDGLDALEKLGQKKYRAVVTDLEMPRMNGYDLCEAIRSMPALRNLPIIVCTSRASDKHRRRAADAGADGYITKPFSKEEIVAEIMRVTEWRGSGAKGATGTAS